jgi:hypothetical protein
MASEKSRKEEAIQVLQWVRGGVVGVAIGSCVVGIVFPFPRVLLGCAAVCYTCFESSVVLKNWQHVYTTVNPVTLVETRTSTALLLNHLTKGAPMMSALLPIVAPQDTHNHFFP